MEKWFYVEPLRNQFQYIRHCKESLRPSKNLEVLSRRLGIICSTLLVLGDQLQPKSNFVRKNAKMSPKTAFLKLQVSDILIGSLPPLDVWLLQCLLSNRLQVMKSILKLTSSHQKCPICWIIFLSENPSWSFIPSSTTPVLNPPQGHTGIAREQSFKVKEGWWLTILR